MSEPTFGFRFRIIHPDGRHETLVVDAERALIGSAAHCEVRLAPESAAHEHVEVFASGGVIHYATRPLGRSARPPVIDRTAAYDGAWAPSSVLSLGGARIQVELLDLTPPKARFPFVALLALVPLAAALVFALVLSRRTSNAQVAVPDAPALLPPRGTATCPNVAADQRIGLAGEKLRIASAKRERSPFAPQDGYEAVVLFETAAACYRSGGSTAEAAEAERAADALRQKLDEDYRLRRVRLEHAYRVHDPRAAKRELAVLIPMTSQSRGPYSEWLAALDRAASAEIDATGRLAP